MELSEYSSDLHCYKVSAYVTAWGDLHCYNLSAYMTTWGDRPERTVGDTYHCCVEGWLSCSPVKK